MVKVRVLFVCMGNICRSPTAHGAFRRLVREQGFEELIEIDSAGTSAYHIDEPPDRRAQKTASGHGIDLSDLRARQVSGADFDRFDYLIAMDRTNLRGLEQICPRGYEYKLRLFMEFAPAWRLEEVPDPYYGGPSGFERVFDMCEDAASGLLELIRAEHLGHLER